MLKRIDQSLNASAIKRSLEVLAHFRNYFLVLALVLDALTLSDKATDYYATWLTKADHQQIVQLRHRHKAYLHLLAFIKHQLYTRQDNAMTVLLKSVTTMRSSIRHQLTHQYKTKRAPSAYQKITIILRRTWFFATFSVASQSSILCDESEDCLNE